MGVINKMKTHNARGAGKNKKKRERVPQRVRQRKVKREARSDQQENQQKDPDCPWTPKKGTGIMFVKHLPMGFYENEMRQFFEQFGEVLRVLVARSPKTQLARGYGFVQFRYYEVAEIAAQAINNYMMFNRVLKTSVLPRTMTNIPRNFGRAFSSTGDQTQAYQRWLQRKVRKSNSYVVGQQSMKRCAKGIDLLMHAKAELAAVGIELPEMESMLAKLNQQKEELQQAEQKELERMELERAAENAAEGEGEGVKKEMKAESEEAEEEEDANSQDSEDEDAAFTPLKPSDWTKFQAAERQGSGGNGEPEDVRKLHAVMKAENAETRFSWEKKKAEMKVTEKESTAATATKTKSAKAKLPLSKKKEGKSDKKAASAVGKTSKKALATKSAKTVKA